MDLEPHHIHPIRCPACGHIYELKEWPKWVRYHRYCYEYLDEGPHIHLKCNICRYKWAMELAPSPKSMNHVPTHDDTKRWLDERRKDYVESKK